MADASKRAHYSQDQRFDHTDANRVSSLTDRRQWDGIVQRAWVRPDGVNLAEDDLAFFGGDFLVSYTSGAREAGMVFSIAPGSGFKFLDTQQADANEPTMMLLHKSTATAVNLAASHATLTRIDEIYVKSNQVNGDNASRDFINPSTGVISSVSTPTTKAYGITVQVAQGTPSGSPAAPAVPAGFDAEDRIATITVVGGSGSFTLTDLVDQRVVLTPFAQDATTTRKGVAQYATTAEIVSATPPADRMISPALLLADWSVAAPGYIKLPGGLIIQWGVATTSGSTVTVTLPVALSTSIYSVLAIRRNTGSGTTAGKPNAGNPLTQIDLVLSTGNDDINWLVIGK